MKFFQSVKHYGALPAVTGLVSVALPGVAFASETQSNLTTPADWAPVLKELTNQVSVSTIMTALATFVGACIVLVFAWWGVRKGVRSLMSAFRKGKLSV